MFLGLIHQGPLNVAYNHVDGNLVLDASRHDDICGVSDLALIRYPAGITDLLCSAVARHTVESLALRS